MFLRSRFLNSSALPDQDQPSIKRSRPASPMGFCLERSPCEGAAGRAPAAASPEAVRSENRMAEFAEEQQGRILDRGKHDAELVAGEFGRTSPTARMMRPCARYAPSKASSSLRMRRASWERLINRARKRTAKSQNCCG